MGDGLGHAPLVLASVAEIDQRPEMSRVELDRPLVAGQSLVGPTQCGQGGAQVVPGVGQVRLQDNRPPEAVEGLLRSSQARPGQSQVVVHRRQPRRQGRRLAEGLQGLLRPALVQEGEAQVVVRLREVRLQRDGPPEAACGLVGAAELQEGQPQIIAGAGGVRLEVKHLLEARRRLVEPAHPESLEGERVERVRIVRASPFLLCHGNLPARSRTGSRIPGRDSGHPRRGRSARGPAAAAPRGSIAQPRRKRRRDGPAHGPFARFFGAGAVWIWNVSSPLALKAPRFGT